MHSTMFYEWPALAHIFHAHDAVCDGFATSAKSQCRLCFHPQREHHSEQRKVIQIILWDLSIFRHVLQGNGRLYGKLRVSRLRQYGKV
jgi:hypothetical protein